MIRSTYEDPVSFLYMLLQVEMVLICVITQMTRVGPYILMRIHMAFIAWKERKSFIANIALVKLLIIFYVNTFNMFLPLVICLKKFIAERTWQSWRFM